MAPVVLVVPEESKDGIILVSSSVTTPKQHGNIDAQSYSQKSHGQRSHHRMLIRRGPKKVADPPTEQVSTEQVLEVENSSITQPTPTPNPTATSTSFDTYPTSASILAISQTSSATSTPISTSVPSDPIKIALQTFKPYFIFLALAIIGFSILTFLCCCVRWKKFTKKKPNSSDVSKNKTQRGSTALTAHRNSFCSTANIICGGAGNHRCSNCGTIVVEDYDYLEGSDLDKRNSFEDDDQDPNKRVSFNIKVDEFGSVAQADSEVKGIKKVKRKKSYLSRTSAPVVGEPKEVVFENTDHEWTPYKNEVSRITTPPPPTTVSLFTEIVESESDQKPASLMQSSDNADSNTDEAGSISDSNMLSPSSRSASPTLVKHVPTINSTLPASDPSTSNISTRGSGATLFEGENDEYSSSGDINVDEYNFSDLSKKPIEEERSLSNQSSNSSLSPPPRNIPERQQTHPLPTNETLTRKSSQRLARSATFGTLPSEIPNIPALLSSQGTGGTPPGSGSTTPTQPNPAAVGMTSQNSSSTSVIVVESEYSSRTVAFPVVTSDPDPK